MKKIHPPSVRALKRSIAAIACMAFVCIALPAHGKPPHDKATPTPEPKEVPPSAQLPGLMHDVLDKISTPLDAKGFTAPESIASLRESFADESAQAPQTMKPAYQADMQVCDALAEALDERSKAKASLMGSNTVHGDSTLGAERVDLPTWLQAVREDQEQRQRNKDSKNADKFLASALESAWLTRVTQLRAGVEQLYQRGREAERQCKAAETLESQKRAVALYPQLGVPDSALNKEFLQRSNTLKAANDPMLQNPDWPELLVKTSSDAISAPSPTPTAIENQAAVSQPASNAPTPDDAPAPGSNTASPAAHSNLVQALAESKWQDPDPRTPPRNSWFVLRPDMSLRCGWRPKVHTSWAIINDTKIWVDIHGKPRNLTLNKDLTEARDETNAVYKRIDKPAVP